MIDTNKPTVEASIGRDSYLTRINWNNGNILADEPRDKGGNGMHPDPFSLLAASLAACTLITLRMYTDRKGWNINHINISVNVSQERNGTQTETIFTKHIEYEPEITSEQRQRLSIIASKCPVAKTLMGTIKLLTQ